MDIRFLLNSSSTGNRTVRRSGSDASQYEQNEKALTVETSMSIGTARNSGKVL
jgi:hypothetical protein